MMYETVYSYMNHFGLMLPLLLIPTALMMFAFWELIWKGFALWKAGKHNQPWWFFFILITNTLGLLPIAYLLFFQRKEKKGKK